MIHAPGQHLTHPLSLFDRVYIINLASREDRRREMRAQLESIGIGIPYSDVEFFEATRPDSPGEFPSIGARGCFYSHLGVLRDAQENKYSSILILEDDLNFSKDCLNRCVDIFHDLQEHSWGFFYGGYRIDSEVEVGVCAGSAFRLHRLRAFPGPSRTGHFHHGRSPRHDEQEGCRRCSGRTDARRWRLLLGP